MTERSIEDRLREQYFTLLPQMVRVAEHLKTQVQYSLLPIARLLTPQENLAVRVRVKDCTSAIDKLRQYNPLDPSAARNPGGVFDRDLPQMYNLLSLRDLIGIRVLVFPSRRAIEVDAMLHQVFPDWESDPILDGGEQLGLKYHGSYSDSTNGLPCEYQIVSTLIGLFWEVEHAAIYKQAPTFKAGLPPIMQAQTSHVYRALKAFEDEFEHQISRAGVSTAQKGFS